MGDGALLKLGPRGKQIGSRGKSGKSILGKIGHQTKKEIKRGTKRGTDKSGFARTDGEEWHVSYKKANWEKLKKTPHPKRGWRKQCV